LDYSLGRAFTFSVVVAHKHIINKAYMNDTMINFYIIGAIVLVIGAILVVFISKKDK